MDERKSGLVATEVVANFFQTIGRRTTDEVAGEEAFPLGGYFNVFRGKG